MPGDRKGRPAHDGPLVVRPARGGDAGALAEIFLAARRTAMPYLPELHSDAETREYLALLVRAGGTWLAERDRIALGFVVLTPGCIEHLYVVPVHQRQGVGSALLRHAQGLAATGLELWVFQRNVAARSFYERHGFVVARLTDGAGNEEREPDALLRWARDRD